MKTTARDRPLAFCFGVHNHQPVGNFDAVVEEATERGYRPFLDRLRARPEVRLTAHFTGNLLEWLRERAPATFDLLGALVARGQVELLTGGFYEPILAVVPDHDKIGQIERLTDFIKSHFGVRARGMWLAERVWEPYLPRPLREAGIEYVLVDDSHFAGLHVEDLDGYYVTEEQGAVLGVFPISQQLRYLIPFAEVERTVEYLAKRRGRCAALTVVDDGEKFGVWPGTYAHCYTDGWLDRFFDALLSLPWLVLSTLGEVIDRWPPTGRIYMPSASYREMQAWAPGGFWRGFLVKYPEVADMHWKMLRLSQAIHREAARRPDDRRLAAARAAVWRGQANDAYWHGVFGGCYLPHLRRAVKQALLEAERRLADAVGAPDVEWTRGDLNGDGRVEITARTPALTVTVNPEAGGTVTELAAVERGLDLADVLARRPETYHAEVRARVRARVEGVGPGGVRTIHEPPVPKEAGLETLLQYDEARRASLLDGLFDAGEPLDPVAPWAAARLTFAGARLASDVQAVSDGLTITMRLLPEEAPLALEKIVTVHGATLQAHYRLRQAVGAGTAGARWAVQWNLALTAGEAPDRYLALPGRPSLASRGRQTEVTSITLVDEWARLDVTLGWSPAAEIAWGPVETVSLSEGGFERIYQGTAFLITWSLDDVSSGEWTLTTDLMVRSR